MNLADFIHDLRLRITKLEISQAFLVDIVGKTMVKSIFIFSTQLCHLWFTLEA
jgi:hypothetical protein